jgi:hypothetical protein
MLKYSTLKHPFDMYVYEKVGADMYEHQSITVQVLKHAQ